MRSPEYPDLLFVPARSFDSGRPQRPRWIVVHTTEGHEGPEGAENGAHYDSTRTDGTSAHYHHDEDSTVQCVRTTDRAHSARAHGNLYGIHHECAGKAGQGKAGWADASSQGEIRNLAKQCARDARKWQIPIRRLTSAEVRNGALGFCGHNEITIAFPEDKGTHWDPGPDFPWAQFLSLVQQYTNGDDDDMPSAEDVADAVKTAVVNKHGLTVGIALERSVQAADHLDDFITRQAAQPAAVVVLAPDQLEQLADKVVTRLQASELVWKTA
jgi:hypothetical protein